MKFNCRISQLAPSASISLMEKARLLKANGVDVISLAGGEPDYATPECASSAGIDGILQGKTHYVNSRGIPELRKRLAKKMWEENGIDYTEDEILITPGAKYAIFATLFTLLSPGEEVIILNPCWVSYGPMVEMAGGVPVYIDLTAGDNYAITKEKLQPYLTDKTKAIILNTPNNPTGRVLKREEAEVLQRLAIEFDLNIISDEIYEKVIFDGRKHISIASLPDMKDHVVTINGLSKCAAMTGWRVGYLASSKYVVDMIYLMYQHTITCISEFSQMAAIAALDHPVILQTMTTSYLERRDLWQERMDRISAVKCRKAEGTFYTWMEIDKDGMSPEQIAEYILEKAQIVVVPGTAYGECNSNYVRVSLATAKDDLMRAADRLAKIL